MSSPNSREWRDFSQPYQCFGPLMTPAEILRLDGKAGLDHYDGRSLKSLLSFSGYIANFLTNAHPDLGRPGPVCPFTSGALSRGLLRLTASPLDCSEEAVLIEAMEQMRGAFERMTATDGAMEDIYKAIVVVFPNLPFARAGQVIESVQKKLKPSYIREGMMIGEFYPGCAAPGLHNPAFRPLEAPEPSLAIRRITIYDAPFMVDQDDYLVGYLEGFGEEGAQRLLALLDRGAVHLSAGRIETVYQLINAWRAMNGSNPAEVNVRR